MNVIECTNVQRSFASGVPILNGLDLTVTEGSVVGLVGRNASGKTTLLKSLLGQIRPRDGEIRVFGLDPFKEPVAVRSRIGYVAEALIFPAWLRVGEALAFHRRLYPGWDETFEEQLVERFEIDRRAQFGKLSKGKAQQASLICAIAHRPPLLLLDEPAGGLDPAARKAFLDVYIDLINRGPVTILLSSHDMLDVERICNEIAILHKGKMLIKGELAEIREGMTLATIPSAMSVRFKELAISRAAFPGRNDGDDIQFVLRAPLEECRASLNGGMSVKSMTLSDLFIELTGGAI